MLTLIKTTNMSALKKVSSIVSTSITFLFVATSVYAADPLVAPPAGSVDPTKVKVESVPQLVITVIFSLAIFLAVVYLMYGGIKWMTSRGDKTAVESARKHIMSAIIGLIVVAGTFFILQVIFNLLGAKNPLAEGFKLPSLLNPTGK